MFLLRNLRTNLFVGGMCLALFTLSLGMAQATDQNPLTGDDPTGLYPTLDNNSTGDIIQILYEDLECPAIVTFDDIAGGPAPGVNYDEIFESIGAKFAERFMGQVLTDSGGFDILSGGPSNPLSLQVGLAGQNLGIYDYDSNTMYGLGHVGYPESEAIGEGSFAVLFDFDQSEFGFDLLGGNDGPAILNFFRRDGSLIDSIEIPNLFEESYGFMRANNLHDIAGISIHNVDPGGIGIDDICHDVEGVVGDPPVCNAGGPYSGSAGVVVTFDGSGSYDPDGTIVEYNWDFGDGNTGTGMSVDHTYADDGAFVVTLCVIDNDGYESCCAALEPVVSAEEIEWGSIKAQYR